MQEIYKKLTEYIKEYNKIVIMTHANPDLDGMSSAILLYNVIKEFKKEVYIYTKENTSNKAVNTMLDNMKKHNYNFERIYNNYKKIVDNNTLLIILDVNRESLLENKNLLSITKNVIVIDHHILAKDYIKDTTMSYVNSNLSSIAEFCVGYIVYLNKTIYSYLATCLLAAMEIDTNNFNIKTTADTHEKAAHLLELGADNVDVQDLLKEKKEEYLKRQDFLKNSFIINGNIAICIFDNNIYTKVDLALSSEELITFDNIAASFTIGKIDNNVIGISARSTGLYNVEQIMTQLGGGGHTTEAACEIKNETIISVEKKLLEVLK